MPADSTGAAAAAVAREKQEQRFAAAKPGRGVHVARAPIIDYDVGDDANDASRPAMVYLPFEEALVRARSLMLKNKTEWKVWIKSDGMLCRTVHGTARTSQHMISNHKR